MSALIHYPQTGGARPRTPHNDLPQQERARLVASVEGLCRKLAAIAWMRWTPAGELEDFQQAARLGAFRAAERFRPELGLAYTTYATCWIRKELRELGLLRGCLVRQAAHSLGGKNGRQNLVGIPLDPEHEHLRVDPQAADPFDVAAGNESHTRNVAQAGQLLAMVRNPRDREILRMRFGIGYPEGMTLEEIAGRIGRSKERVRQVVASEIKRIRKRLMARAAAERRARRQRVG